MNGTRLLSSFIWLGVLLALGFSSGACNNVPVKAITGTFSVQNEVTDQRPEIPKIDILWVIDNSNSMCEEQINLTKNFETFIKGFSETIQADFRIAVTTTYATGPNGGKFQTTQGEYETCSRQFTYDCTKDPAGDAVCEAQFGPGWKCDYAGVVQTFSNGKVNSTCVRRCGDDQTCNAEFTDGQYHCFGASTFNTPNDFSSCRLQNDPTKCDGVDVSVGYITNNTADVKKAFECIATVGTTGEAGAQVEMGLLAAKLALDKSGKNGTQATNFLRDDAFLAIIFVSDEEDCSIKDGQKFTEDELFRCGFVAEKLEQVGEFVKFFKRLKKDPGKVIVAAIAGDAKIAGLQTSDPKFNLDPRVIQERDSYLTTKQLPNEAGAYICSSDNGRADFGRRYRELIDKFGSNGVFANICDNDFGPALQLIAKKIIDIFAGSCLSRPIKLGGLKLPGVTCGADTECLYKVCSGGTCQALAELNETCAQNSDCYSGTCTGNVCTCTGSCPNKYTSYQPFIQVQKIAADKSAVTLAGTEYTIQELAKCVQDTNPKGLAVIPNTPPELGSTLKILYESETLTGDTP